MSNKQVVKFVTEKGINGLPTEGRVPWYPVKDRCLLAFEFRARQLGYPVFVSRDEIGRFVQVLQADSWITG